MGPYTHNSTRGRFARTFVPRPVAIAVSGEAGLWVLPVIAYDESRLTNEVSAQAFKLLSIPIGGLRHAGSQRFDGVLDIHPVRSQIVCSCD